MTPLANAATTFTILDFTNATVTSSGTGPTATTRWGGIGIEDGTTFDLIVTVASSSANYDGTPAQLRPSVEPGIAGIRMETGQSAVFNFEFVNSATDAPLILERLQFSVLDIDRIAGIENVSFDTASVTGNSPSMAVSFLGSSVLDLGAGGGFTNRYTGNGVDIQDPTDPLGLSDAQLARSLRIDLTDVNSFQLGYGVDLLPAGALRGFFFTGTSAPEPSSAMLVGAGAMLALTRRRRS